MSIMVLWRYGIDINSGSGDKDSVKEFLRPINLIILRRYLKLNSIYIINNFMDLFESFMNIRKVK